MALAVVLIVAIPIALGYALAFEDVEHFQYEEVRTINVTDQMNNGVAPMFALRDPAEVNSWRVATAVYEDSSGEIAIADGVPALMVYNSVGATHTSIPYKEVYASPGTVVSASGIKSMPYLQTWQAKLTNGNVVNFSRDDLHGWLQQSSSDASGAIGTLTYYNIPAQSFLTLNNVRSLTVTTSTSGYIDYSNSVVGSYADWTAGWSLSGAGHFPLSGEFFLYAIQTYNLDVRFGDVKITTAHHLIRGQDYLSITVGDDDPIDIYQGRTAPYLFSFSTDRNGQLTISFYGEAEGERTFPALGTRPPVLWSTTTAVTSSVVILTDGFYRFDRASVEVSDYPTMTDAAFSMNQYMPNANGYEFSTSKIAQLGSSVTFANESYAVDASGYIRVASKNVALNNAVFRSVIGSDNLYHNSINGADLGTTPAPASIQFGGTWAMITQAVELKSTTTTTTEWQPGVFSYDAFGADYAVVGLLGCVATFIGLGIVGRRTGAKVGALLLICGAGALFFLMLV